MTENIETEMTTEELLAQRQQVYGDRVANMTNVGTMWSGYLRARFPDVDITAVDVSLMMAMYKEYRMSVEPSYSDNIDDVDGYMAMARECIGDDLIKARTVDEFIMKRAKIKVQMVKRYLTPEELADDNLYVPTMEDLHLITNGAGNPPIQHQCYNIGHTPTDSKICARCGDPMYGHPDWAEFITAQEPSAFTDEERSAAELERKNRAYNRVEEQADLEEEVRTTEAAAIRALDVVIDRADGLRRDLLGTSDKANETVNAEREAIGLPPEKRPAVVLHELKLVIAGQMDAAVNRQNLIDLGIGFSTLFEDVFTRDRNRDTVHRPQLTFSEVKDAYDAWESINKGRSITPSRGGANAVWRLLVDDRGTRE